MDAHRQQLLQGLNWGSLDPELQFQNRRECSTPQESSINAHWVKTCYLRLLSSWAAMYMVIYLQSNQKCIKNIRENLHLKWTCIDFFFSCHYLAGNMVGQLFWCHSHCFRQKVSTGGLKVRRGVSFYICRSGISILYWSPFGHAGTTGHIEGGEKRTSWFGEVQFLITMSQL